MGGLLLRLEVCHPFELRIVLLSLLSHASLGEVLPYRTILQSLHKWVIWSAYRVALLGARLLDLLQKGLLLLKGPRLLLDMLEIIIGGSHFR